MEKIIEQGLLYDFYGELLTKHQREIYEDYVYNNFSVSEIAQEEGISRQGVHDLIKRCNKILENYEKKLQLVKKFMATKEKVNQIHQLTKEYQEHGKSSLLLEIESISEEILDSF